MNTFLTDDFLLDTETAKALYHAYAAKMPIADYHCHIDPKEKYCQAKGVPVYPGCTTATDYHTAYKLGLEVLKFFPAEQSGGLAKIKALSAPFPMFKVMPTGGISLKNLKDYLSCPVICACGGSYMVTADLIDNQKWDEIVALCKESVAIVKQVRGNG